MSKTGCFEVALRRLSRRDFLAVSGAAAAGFAAGLGQPAAAAAAGRLAIDLGVCASFDKAALAKEAGLAFLEGGVSGALMPDKPEADFQKSLEKAKASVLPMRSCNGFFPGQLKLTGPETKHEEALKYGAAALERAGRAGIGIIVLGSGGARKVPDGFDKAKAEGQFIEFCRKLGPFAEKAGVTVVLEPLNKGETNLLNSVAEGIRYVDEIGHPNIQLLADFYHMMREDEGPESIVKAGKRLRHCHIAEKKNRTAPGVDGDDFRPFFKALKEIGYKGLLAFECRWGKIENELAKAREYVQKQITQV